MNLEPTKFKLSCTFGNRIVGDLVKQTIVIILNCALLSIKYRFFLKMGCILHNSSLRQVSENVSPKS